MPKGNSEHIYDEKFVENLFNRMSKNYGLTNYISSFGFTERWRQKCVKEINWNSSINEGYDLMSGMGESWHLILKQTKVKIVGVDISTEMNKKARSRLTDHKNWQVDIIEDNILKNSLMSESADFVISTFGIKTFSKKQQEILAQEIHRILRKNGQFSLVEISEPKPLILKLPFMFYLKFLIPIIGKIFQGDSLDYKMLGVYCTKFKNCQQFKEMLEKVGLQVKIKHYFFGCATCVTGYK